MFVAYIFFLIRNFKALQYNFLFIKLCFKVNILCFFNRMEIEATLGRLIDISLPVAFSSQFSGCNTFDNIKN